MTTDPVLAELDAEIALLEGELDQARTMRAWWAGRLASKATANVPVAPKDDEVDNGDADGLEDPDGGGPNDTLTAREWVLRELSWGEKTIPQIRDGALQHGWKTTSKHPYQVVRNNLAKLVEEGVVVKDGPQYRLPEAEIEDGASDAPADPSGGGG